MNRLKLEPRSGSHAVYTLDGREVHTDEELDYETPVGWVRGLFEWSGNLNQWARLMVPYPNEQERWMIIVLPPEGARCRWPNHEAAPVPSRA